MAMAPGSSCSTSSSSSYKSPHLPPLHHSPLFPPIQECEEEEEEEEDPGQGNDREINRRTISTMMPQRHSPTILHHCSDSHNKVPSATTTNNPSAPDPHKGWGTSVLCGRCRPHARDKISIVPLENLNHPRSSAVLSPNGILKSIVSTLTRKSPRLDEASPSSSVITVGEERWKVVFAELSHKLVKATRKRDEAISEVARLKSAISELDKKLDRLESYSSNLKNDIEQCSTNLKLPHRIPVQTPTPFTVSNSSDKIIERFLFAIADARSMVRILSWSLTMQLRSSGGGQKVNEKLLIQLKPYKIKAAVLTRDPRGLACYLEVLLNKAFFEDFESTGFEKSGATLVLNPMDRCMANLEQSRILDRLTWEEVLSKGTKHFSEEFSRFCDRKMSEIVRILGCNQVWPEQLLQAFFGASKSVWLVHLQANSVHPALPIFRVETGAPFDPVYMEDMSADKARRLVPSCIRAMVAPGFNGYDSVVKCKVLCRYHPGNIRSITKNLNNKEIEGCVTVLSP